jgi:hypothetical protein
MLGSPGTTVSKKDVVPAFIEPIIYLSKKSSAKIQCIGLIASLATKGGFVLLCEL